MSIDDINKDIINNNDSENSKNSININDNINIINNSLNNLSIFDSKNIDQVSEENTKNLKNDSYFSCLQSSKSTEYSSINDLENNKNKIFEYIYEDFKEKKIKNSIIISNTKEQNKNIYKTLINDFYSKNNIISINNNKKINKICFLVLDLKKFDQLLEELKQIFKDKKISVLKGGRGKKMKNEYDIFVKHLEEADIFLGIPDVFYKFLSIGFIKIYQFSILFLQDCHICEGNHPYNNIMQEFYFYYLYRKYILKINDNFSLPKIIGFSNSPLLNEKIMDKDEKSNKYLINISENLNCQIIQILNKNKSIISYPKEIYEESIEYISFPSILINNDKIDIIYKILNHYFIKEALKLFLKETIIENYLNLIKQKFQKFYSEEKEENIKFKSFSKNLNFLAEESIIFKIFEDILKYLLFIFQNLDVEDIINIFEKYLKLFKDFLISKQNQQQYSFQTLEKMQSLGKIIKSCIGAFQHLKKNFEYNNERISKFLSAIYNIYNKDKNSKILIFVQSRKLSYLLNEFLLRKGYKSEYLTGINIKKEELLHITLLTKTTYNIINETIKKYNSNAINILVCTPSIIDNIQIDKCDYIIIFKKLANLNFEYIKIRKLSLNKNAKIKIFSTNINYFKNIFNEEIKRFENKSSVFLEDNLEIKDYRRENFLEEKLKIIEKNNYYFIEETQAKVSVKNSIVLFNDINNFFIKQNKKIIINKFMDEYFIDKIKKYKCIIQLDKKFGDSIKIFSHSYKDKQTAEGDCYLQLIAFLHKFGIIDNNFKIIDSQ